MKKVCTQKFVRNRPRTPENINTTKTQIKQEVKLHVSNDV